MLGNFFMTRILPILIAVLSCAVTEANALGEKMGKSA